MANENPVIRKVDAETFTDFSSLIDKLAEYEKLAPPHRRSESAATNRLSLSHPKIQRIPRPVRGQIRRLHHLLLHLLKLPCPTNPIHRRHLCLRGIPRSRGGQKNVLLPKTGRQT